MILETALNWPDLSPPEGGLRGQAPNNLTAHRAHLRLVEAKEASRSLTGLGFSSKKVSLASGALRIGMSSNSYFVAQGVYHHMTSGGWWEYDAARETETRQDEHRSLYNIIVRDFRFTPSLVLSYLRSLLLATVGAIFTAAMFGDMLASIVGRPLVIDLQMKPPFPLEIAAGLVIGYISWVKWKCLPGLWVWIVPAVYLVASGTHDVASGLSLKEATAHFFDKSCWPLCDDILEKTIPAMTSAAYSIGVRVGMAQSKWKTDIASVQ